jgi:hypothetical protein
MRIFSFLLLVYALTHPKYRDSLRSWLMKLLGQGGYHSETVDSSSRSHSSNRCRPSCTSSDHRSCQQHAQLCMKYSTTCGTVHTLPQCQRMTILPNSHRETPPSQSGLLCSYDLMQNDSERHIETRMAEDSPDHKNPFDGASYYPCVQRPCRSGIVARDSSSFEPSQPEIKSI